MNKIEQNVLRLVGIYMGIWLLVGSSFFYLFFPEELFTMFHYTISVYALIFVSVIFYFFTKKAFSDLLNVETKRKKIKKNK